MDLAQAVNAPEHFPLGDKEYPVRALTYGEWGPISVYIKLHHPGPVQRVGQAVARARRDGEPLDEETVEMMLSHAHKQAVAWPPRHGSWQWFEALDSIEGSDSEILFVVLSQTVPGFTRADAEAAAKVGTREEWSDILRMALWGERPAPKEEAASASPRPKSSRRPKPSGTNGDLQHSSSSSNAVSSPGNSST